MCVSCVWYFLPKILQTARTGELFFNGLNFFMVSANDDGEKASFFMKATHETNNNEKNTFNRHHFESVMEFFDLKYVLAIFPG